jgi:molybdopterin molybdotransferase
MISVREAHEKILQAISTRPPLNVPLGDGLHRFLAKKVLAPLDSPSFDNSAMDGYALRSQDTEAAGLENLAKLTVVGTLSAGMSWKGSLRNGEAIRIFTGAMIPTGADAVVRQEEVQRADTEIFLKDRVKKGENIRHQGEELKKGELVLEARAALTPASIAQLAGFGLREVPIYSPPRVGILVTGSEIVKAPEDWVLGKVFDCNSFALNAALQEIHLKPTFIGHCRDDREELWRAVTNGLEQTDFLLVTGGISVGDFDFVKEIATQAGVETVFWKVAQKPGKPIFFGKRGEEKFLFGLPGNPASALVCFYEYVRPALLRSMGVPSPLLPSLRCPLAESYRKKAGFAHFLRSSLEIEAGTARVKILEQQGSHLLGSFAQANCLTFIPEATEVLEAGSSVEIHLLPSFIGQRGDITP